MAAVPGSFLQQWNRVAEAHTLLCVTQITNEKLVNSTGHSTQRSGLPLARSKSKKEGI